MKITAIEDLHAELGLGHFSFLKITTDEGLVGWAEFNERAAARRSRQLSGQSANS